MTFPTPETDPQTVDPRDAEIAELKAQLAEGTAAAAEPADPRDAEIARLKAELEKAAGAVEAGAVKVLQQFWLHLADGTVVEHEGAIPTHVQTGDKPPVPVVAAWVR